MKIAIPDDYFDVTQEELDLQFSDIFKQILAVDRGEPVAMINPEVWKGLWEPPLTLQPTATT